MTEMLLFFQSAIEQSTTFFLTIRAQITYYSSISLSCIKSVNCIVETAMSHGLNALMNFFILTERGVSLARST